MDLDADGRDDILSGSWPGQLYLFHRNEDGTFAAGEVIDDRDGSPVKVGSASA
ncbi:MAG: FG-GAP-like repeat-containing protein, partial [Pirellulales bacterium]